MQDEENKAKVCRYFDELAKGNADYAERYFAPGFVFHGSMGTMNREQFLQLHRAFISAFPESEATIDDLIAESDKVVTRYTIRTTHQGDFQGIPPTGKKVTLTGIVISRFEGGQEIEAWEEMDMLGFMQQLGVIPEAG